MCRWCNVYQNVEQTARMEDDLIHAHLSGEMVEDDDLLIMDRAVDDTHTVLPAEVGEEWRTLGFNDLLRRISLSLPNPDQDELGESLVYRETRAAQVEIDREHGREGIHVAAGRIAVAYRYYLTGHAIALPPIGTIASPKGNKTQIARLLLYAAQRLGYMQTMETLRSGYQRPFMCDYIGRVELELRALVGTAQIMAGHRYGAAWINTPDGKPAEYWSWISWADSFLDFQQREIASEFARGDQNNLSVVMRDVVQRLRAIGMDTPHDEIADLQVIVWDLVTQGNEYIAVKRLREEEEKSWQQKQSILGKRSPNAGPSRR